MISSPSQNSMLLIGGSGCLGHHIVRQLIEDPEVSHTSVFDINTQNHQVNGVKYLEGNLRSRETVLKAIQEIDAC
ncbi:hypothetical protein BCON_0168g00150 [Botryotinia convoluta]|uniref:3-beta hydroxysteroid dehydrogenase/isomerase domain-containing protein n=1 Tax=Botryotinia convoluta TaxID=54673 RepID=A0A4Z1HX93_9HELO|nr:hypothetical protein BCON_0168g00150 [Botryotinia convoluta]